MLPKLFIVISLLSSLIFIAHSYKTKLCLYHQRSLLLDLKNELIFDSSNSKKLVQWNQTDECCKWYGVGCNDAGYIVSLQLDEEFISGGIGESSSLFRLEYLEKLNLADNYFFLTNTPIPKGIENLKYLSHLNLSNAGFGGQVPLQLSFLTRLVTLGITSYSSWGGEPLKLEYQILEMIIQNLTRLRELNLGRVQISSFDGNNNSTRKFLDFFANLSSLTSLSLVYCGLEGFFPNEIFQMPTLQYLDLSYNYQLSGSLPPFPHNGSLEFVRLGSTNFSGSIPRSISNLKTLSKIDFSGCKFTGSIPSTTFANLTQLTDVDLSNNFLTGSLSSQLFEGLSSLVYLDLHSNSFSGDIPHTLFGLPSLLELWLQGNNFTGKVEVFPINVINVSNIVMRLDLSNNRLEGPIHDSLFQLQSLEHLDLSRNLFSGTFQLEKIRSLPNLTQLDLSYNNLKVDVSSHNSTSHGYGFHHLEYLFLRSCNLNDFPHFIKHSHNMSYLDLSNNGIGGEIPAWIWGLTQLETLNLTRNLLTGLQKPYHIPSSLEWLDLSSNHLNDFPHFIKHCDDLTTLDLSNNEIGGEIPAWIWGLTQLDTLDLSGNLLTGLQKPYHIPSSLFSLDLSSNQLSGEWHWQQLLTPNITSDLGRLSLANNSLSGSIPTSLCINAPDLVVLDLSANKLSGTIPSCLLAMTSLQALDLGRNNFSSHIPDNLSLDCSLRYFDVNNNTLQGEIPRSLKNCKRLELMNIGNNIINDTFPCMLSSSLRVLVLHSNNFHGEVRCHNSSWPDLQILDISSNNFSGSLETINFSSWKDMVKGSGSQLRHKTLTDNHLGYYGFSSSVTLIMKGLQVELHKIWLELSSIDLSCNDFKGEIPNAIGDLTALHLLNISHNALNGSIPKSVGKLGNLEALDLSRNQLTGEVPMELAGLSFLSVLNLSYNMLVGKIPNGRHLQTFSADSFKGNSGLCGFNLNITCSGSTDENDSSHGKAEEKKRDEIEWEYVSAALGYVVGLASIVWVLVFCGSFRKKYFDKIDDVVQEMFDARDMRRRRRATARRRALRNQAQAVRRH